MPYPPSLRVASDQPGSPSASKTTSQPTSQPASHHPIATQLGWKCLPPLHWLLWQWIRQGIERIANLRETAAWNQRATGSSLPCIAVLTWVLSPVWQSEQQEDLVNKAEQCNFQTRRQLVQGNQNKLLTQEIHRTFSPCFLHCSLRLYCGLICHHCLYILLTQDFKWLSLFCWAINYSVPCVFLVSALSIGLLSYPPFWKRGGGDWCFETEFAKGNTGTSAPTTTFLVGALVKYIYLFQHKENMKKEKQGGKKVVSEYNMETNKLHCCSYNNLD